MQIIELHPDFRAEYRPITLFVSSTAVRPAPAAISPGIFFLFLVRRLISMFQSWHFFIRFLQGIQTEVFCSSYHDFLQTSPSDAPGEQNSSPVHWIN